MKIVCDKQNTPEWEAARMGKITASAIKCVLAKPTTKSYRLYVQELVLDLEGMPREPDDAPWYEAGRQWESWARGWYSWNKMIDVHETGFIVHDDYEWLGCSPDGLVMSESTHLLDTGKGIIAPTEPIYGVEIKFRKYLHTFHEHVTKTTPAAYDQMQASMLVTGLPCWDYVNFWRDDKMDLEQGHVRRIYRDEARINKILERAMKCRADVLRRVMQRR
jgi:hypothetical protein